jgi:hypothetical protein
MERTETGPMKIGDDWTGVFIRGDQALHAAMCIRAVLNGPNDGFSRMTLEGLADILESCREN